MKWNSFHVFYTGNTVNIIQQLVIPLLKKLHNEKLMCSNFFILYSERGNHIRLRIKSETPELILYELVSNLASDYFSKYPSPKEINRPVGNFPNDTVQNVPYEPEYERYGGIRGIEIAESFFYYSSEVVLSCLSQLNSGDDNYPSVISYAIQLHLVTAYVYCDQDIEKCILFFTRCFRNIMPGSSAYYMAFDYKIEKEYALKYEEQKAILIPYVKTIWSTFQSEDVIGEYLEKWKQYESEVHGLLYKAYEDELLDVPATFGNFPLWVILQSYVHMTNNRLGVSPIDEPLIAYFIMRSLMEVK